MSSAILTPGSPIHTSLEGLVLAYPKLLRLHREPDFVVRAIPPAQARVAVISGSGSGHEPLPVGYVGPGMLDAACPGRIFTSPSPIQLVAATRAVAQHPGVVYVVKNYAGGVMTAEMALDLLQEDDIPARTVLVNDDVSISDPSQRRGLGAAVLASKIAGAAAQAGLPLDQVADLAQRMVDRSRSLGVATDACSLEASGIREPLPPGSVEWGVGIHGEPGQIRPMPADPVTLLEEMAATLCADLQPRPGEPLLFMLSNLGGTSQAEIFWVFRHLYHILQAMGLSIARHLVGTYITCLGRGGWIVTLARMDDRLLELWDAPVQTPVLRW